VRRSGDRDSVSRPRTRSRATFRGPPPPRCDPEPIRDRSWPGLHGEPSAVCPWAPPLGCDFRRPLARRRVRAVQRQSSLAGARFEVTHCSCSISRHRLLDASPEVGYSAHHQVQFRKNAGVIARWRLGASSDCLLREPSAGEHQQFVAPSLAPRRPVQRKGAAATRIFRPSSFLSLISRSQVSCVSPGPT